MNSLKHFIFSLTILCAVFFYNQVSSASEPTPETKTQSNGSVLVATVSITNTKIDLQNGNIFNISFDLNNREILQTGVKYGVKLIPKNSKDQTAIDEKVYDESLTLYENSTIKKEIVYTAPSQLSGNYELFIVSNNESGLPLARTRLGEVKLVASSDGIFISPESCYLQVVGEKNGPHYKLTEGVDISSSESLALTCVATNSANTTVSVTPLFETRYDSPYGSIAPEIGGDNSAIVFTKGEKKNFSIVLPKGDLAKFYNVRLNLVAGDSVSNTIFANYTIQGISATIQQLSLDKDYYTSGDKGELSLIWFMSGTNSIRGGKLIGEDSSISLEVSVIGSNGRECIDPIKQPLVRDLENTPKTTLPIAIKMTCNNPQVKATIIADKDGRVLDQKELTFKSNEINKTKKPLPINTTTAIIILVIIIAIIALGVYMKKKKLKESGENFTKKIDL